MPARTADGEPRLQMWRRVREFAVPQSMIATATARRAVGDWAGACGAARVAVDLDLRAVATRYGRELACALRADLRHLAPDLLRWHLPRIAPDGLLRPGLTVTLTRYARADGAPSLHLVARTAPAWAAAGQWVSLTLWDPVRPGADVGRHPHPHPRPSRRFRFDLHRHLWDARSSAELRERCGGAVPTVPPEGGSWAADRWAAEAALLLRATGRASGRVEVRLDRRRAVVLTLHGRGGGAAATVEADEPGTGLPLLPDAATFLPPDLRLLRAGLIEAHALHPLVAAALVPGHAVAEAPPAKDPAARVLLVDCRGERHRIGLVDGARRPLDHDPQELRREELLSALTGTPLPCLQAVEHATRNPVYLDEVRGRLDHGDFAGARAVVEALVGTDAALPAGALRDELDAVTLRRIDHGLYRAGLLVTGAQPHPGADASRPRRPSGCRPRHAAAR